MNMVSIRGATTVENNNRLEIINCTKELINDIEIKNNLKKDNVICILFSSTKDLNAEYPAKAARLLEYTQCGLMCFPEMDIINSIEKCIRIMVLYQDFNIEQHNVKHIYLKGAKTLRPDLNQ